MKKIFALLCISLFSFSAGYSQYFQGTFTNSGNTLIFSMKPSANFSTSISYLELSFRYNTSGTPAFAISNLVNGIQFPGLNMQRRTPDFVSGPYTYVRYVHNTSTITNFSYVGGTPYEIFRLNLIGTGVGNFEMASDLVGSLDEYVFGVVDGTGNFIDPGSNDQLYGPGFNIVGNLQLLPLSNVPIPVKFTGFNVVNKENNGLLNWQVENESALTDFYEVERSLNGRDFVALTQIASKQNGSSANVYEHTDLNLKSLRTDIIYYRIKQIDKDGKFTYTEIKSIRLDGKAFAVNIYPNPVKVSGNVNIDLVDDIKVNIQLTDVTGKEVQVAAINGKKGLNIYTLNMAALSAGTYQLKVIAGNESKVIPVVKSK